MKFKNQKFGHFYLQREDSILTSSPNITLKCLTKSRNDTNTTGEKKFAKNIKKIIFERLN